MCRTSSSCFDACSSALLEVGAVKYVYRIGLEVCSHILPWLRSRVFRPCLHTHPLLAIEVTARRSRKHLTQFDAEQEQVAGSR